MKRFAWLILAAGLCAHAEAQLDRDQALLTEDDRWNLYTKLAPSWCDLGDDHGLWGSVEIGGLLNNKLSFGVRGTVLLDDTEPGFDRHAEVDKMDAALGGIAIEYTFFSRALLHGSLGCFAGLGQVEMGGGSDAEVDVTVVQPALNLMINVSQTIEFGLGLGYRFMDPRGSEAEGLGADDFSGLEPSLFLRLTEF